jgi:Type IV secretion system pilin
MPNPLAINYSLSEMLQIAIAIVVILSWVLAVLYSIWGGFLLITSGWNEEKVKPAVNHIRHAFLGLIVLILILFIAPKALSLFGLPFADDLKPSIIFAKMSEISGSFFGTKNSSWGDIDNINTTNSLPADFSDL